VSAYQGLGCCWSGIGSGDNCGEANRLLSLELSSLEDGSQLLGRACYYSLMLSCELGTFRGQNQGYQSRGGGYQLVWQMGL
jgi:hypothetical protein